VKAMSQPSGARPPRIVSATSRPPLRLWGWPLWLAPVLAAVATRGLYRILGYGRALSGTI